MDHILARVEQRFRSSQLLNGWGYTARAKAVRPRGSLTCAGLLGLAVGCSVTRKEAKGTPVPERSVSEDEGIQRGLRALAEYMEDPTERIAIGGSTDRIWGKQGTLSIYFLWSVERVGVFCNLKTIGGKDWYRWGVELLLPAQSANGSWFGWGTGSPISDTCFALLFLKRADLMPGLAKQLRQRVAIRDPGPASPGDSPKEGVGKQPDSPGEKAAPPPESGPLAVSFKGLQAGQEAPRRLVVRGPAPFRITALRGTDARLSAQADAQKRKAHELTLTLRPDKAGEFKQTLRLQTDLPGQAEVLVEVRGRVAPAQAKPAFPLADQ